ncbi:transposase [Breznakia sp. OttesenSCG-928-G09]|nr:transposase [Breznakia sp. OttesenSCG-928-G09]
MANHHYEPELKQTILRLYLEEDQTKKSLTQEYNLVQGTLTYWLQQYRKECEKNPTKQEESDSHAEAKRLREEIEELKKENDFLKNATAFFAKEID